MKQHILRQSLTTAFIDGTQPSNLAYKPQFVSNNSKEGRKVLSSIEQELENCDAFSISVAFITMGGITPLLQTLEELEKRKVPGRILTTDYLTFSEPRALEKLASFENIVLKMYASNQADEGFHTKGYIFKEKEIYRIIVGSSNMTLSALTRNREWNTRLVSTEQGELAQQIVAEFNQLWSSRYSLDYNDFIQDYKTRYELIKKQKQIVKQMEVPSIDQYQLQPNSMQTAVVQNLQKLKREGASRGLLISATGDGGIIVTSQAKTA